MGRFRVKKVLVAYWFNVEAKSVTQAAFKTRRQVPDRQVVHESEVTRKSERK